MIIKNQLRPTVIRTNSRYRGQTELQKFTNFIQEAVHDIKLLGNVMDTNEYTEDFGHTDYIYTNFAKLVDGTEEGSISNTPSASTLCHPTDNVFPDLNLLDLEWTTYGNCVRSGTKEKVGLLSPGTADPSGIGTQLLVEEGNIIYIRMGVRVLSGDVTAFTIGSDNIRNGEGNGDLKSFNLGENDSIIYLDKRLYCQHREAINLNIDIHRLADALEPAEIELTSVEIKFMRENNVSLSSSNRVLKPRLNLLDDKIDNIVSHM